VLGRFLSSHFGAGKIHVNEPIQKSSASTRSILGSRNLVRSTILEPDLRTWRSRERISSSNDPVDLSPRFEDSDGMKERVTVLPLAIVVCLLAQPATTGQERIDFLQKSIVTPVTPGMPRTKILGEQIDFFEK